MIYQYIQHWRIAKDFANYLDLYNKYKKDYRVQEILQGRISDAAVDKIRRASFDEKLSVIGLLLSALHELFAEAHHADQYVTGLFGQLKDYKDLLGSAAQELSGEEAQRLLEAVAGKFAKEFARQKKAEHITREGEHVQSEIQKTLERYTVSLKADLPQDGQQAFVQIKEWFSAEPQKRSRALAQADAALNFAFDFLERAFGDSQEMVVFITEMNTDYYAAWFVDVNGCDRFYKYNKSLLFSERQQGILKELADIEELL